ncbi:MAG: putative F420-0 ABC transporter substrate-binding protein [Microbacteriaceae bacterium]|nr:putative F420-0 ABC transporter substrate-binding protein [Microbacteriaceae bacterium]
MLTFSRRIAVLSICTLALAGCVSAQQAPLKPSVTPPPGVASSINNCGVVVPITPAPARVITIKSTSTEMLLALGLGDRIVGTAFQDGPVPDRWSAAAAALPVLADKVPSQEVVLNATPDFVYAGWESNFSSDGAGTRADLAALGIRSYVSPAACKGAAFKPAQLTFDDIDHEISEVALLFGVDDTALLAEQDATLGAIRKDARDLSALWFSSGSDIPYVGAGTGAPQLILDTIGVRNIAADVKDTWASYNWESVIAANPDVIVLVDASWSTTEKKIGVLEGNPATAKLDAVRNHRYLIVPFAASEAGVRTVDAAADLATQLRALDLG